MQVKGKLTSWFDDKGYGFITPNQGKERIFVHIRDFSPRNPRPRQGESLQFSPSKDKSGRPCAVKVQRPDVKAPGVSAAWFVAVCFLLLLSLAVFAGYIPPAVPVIYLLLSLVTLVAYAKDKSAAKNGDWRVAESTLHLMALLGGWPGALIARKVFRHKTKKPAFRVVFWFTLALNCAALTWLVYGEDRALALSWLNALI